MWKDKNGEQKRNIVWFALYMIETRHHHSPLMESFGDMYKRLVGERIGTTVHLMAFRPSLNPVGGETRVAFGHQGSSLVPPATVQVVGYSLAIGAVGGRHPHGQVP